MISFNEEMAAEYGLSVIIFCTKIGDWLKWNKANEQNFYDGKYWTYNSLKALTLLFPFWSTDQLRKVIKDAMDRKLIVKGNYNKSPYDKTLWYTLTDLGCKLLKIPMWENHHIGTGTLPHPNVGNPTPIPIKSIHKINNNKSSCKKPEKAKIKSENEKKHLWAEENKKAPLADVTSQSNSYTPQPKASDKPSEILEEFMKKEKNAPKKTTKLSTRTALQSKIPPRNEPDGQGAAIDAKGYQDNPSNVRGSDGLLEARGVYSFLEKVGMAGYD